MENQESTLRKIAVILAADVVGYSTMVRANEEQTIAMLKAMKETIAEPTIKHRGGRIFHTAGDSIFAEFTSPVEGYRAAQEIQEALLSRNRLCAESERINLRIGMHVGDVLIEGANLMGDAVNVAARIEGLAPIGGVLISRAMRDQISASTSLAFVSQGRPELKGIGRKIEVYRVMSKDEADKLAAEQAKQEKRKRTIRMAIIGGVSAVAAACVGLAIVFRDSLLDDGKSAVQNYNEGRTADKNGNVDEAKRMFLAAYRKGKVPGAANSLCGYAWGDRGQTFDIAQAVKWCPEGAKENFTWSLHRYGLMYLYGLGVERDLNKAADLCRKGREAGEETANEWCEAAARKASGEELKWAPGPVYVKPANPEYSQAELKRSREVFYDNRDQATGFKMFEKLYREGAPVSSNLCDTYFEGKGVAFHADLAVRFCTEGMTLSPWTRYRLGLLYLSGIGVERDLDKAKDHCLQSVRVEQRAPYTGFCLAAVEAERNRK